MLGGATRLDLIQRMSTNDMTGIAEGESRPTVLTTAIGRIVDRVTVLALADRWAVITSPGRGEAVRTWLGRHIFFQDDVTLEAAPSLRAHWFLAGPGSEQALRSLRNNDGSAPAGRALSFPEGLAWAAQPPEPRGLHLSMESPSTLPADGPWSAAVDPADAEAAYQALRIEAGYPEFGREFSDNDIPLEVGLTYAVSFTKGCYLGQEIIARMESRARTPRRLVGVRLPHRAEVPREIPHGRLTSVAVSPRLGWIGLAVVRPEALLAPLSIDGDPCELLELPFP
jgi:aminomethyltransferase